MLSALSRPMVRIVDRYLPDPFVFVALLTLIAALAAMGVQSATPMEVITVWGNGFWGLLSFSMQMLLVLVTGFMLASTPLVTRALTALAGLAKTPGAAIVLVSLVSLFASWLNWGFGLVVGALFAKELARQIRVDYRLLVASAYSGFIVWHGGLAGSVPLSIATPDHPFTDLIGLVPTSQSIFAPFNLIILGALFVAVPLVNRAMMPKDSEAVYVDPALLKQDSTTPPAERTPAEWAETTPVLPLLIGFGGLAWLFQHFASGSGLSLNVINFAFLMLAILLHGTPRNLLAALQKAIAGGAGIVIQFPFYAGIMAIMVETGLAATMSERLIGLASAASLPFWTFLSAGLVNFFVPSGGGQWAVQAPVVLPAAQALGTDLPRVAMAVAWGDAWTNMVQPFWALPILGIAGLKAKDIMGFCIIHLLITGVIISAGLTLL